MASLNNRQIFSVSGDTSSDGRTVFLKVATKAGAPFDLALEVADVQKLVTLLLVLANDAAILADSPRASHDACVVPIPLRTISVGDCGDGGTLLMVEVGTASMAFALPPDATREIGGALLALSAPCVGRPM